MVLIYIIILIASIALWADFSRSGSIVKDNRTGLEWQDDIEAFNMYWQVAIDYCESLSLDGGGWRLPNKNELISIVDYSVSHPSIYSEFENTTSGYYFSSTTDVDSIYYLWYVDFKYGDVNSHHKSYHKYVRCVRAGQ